MKRGEMEENMINRFVNMLIQENIINELETEIYQYGLFVLIFNFICLATVIFFGYVDSQLFFTIIFLIFYAPFRMIIGGYHCKTPLKCYIYTNLVFVAILLFNKLILYNELLWILSIVLGVILLGYYFFKEKKLKITLLLIGLLLGYICIGITFIDLRMSFAYAIYINVILYFGKELKYY